MVDLGMTFVDNWVVGKEKGCYWLSNDIVGLVGNLCWVGGKLGRIGMAVTAWVSPSSSPSSFTPVFSFV